MADKLQHIEEIRTRVGLLEHGIINVSIGNNPFDESFDSINQVLIVMFFRPTARISQGTIQGAMTRGTRKDSKT